MWELLACPNSLEKMQVTVAPVLATLRSLISSICSMPIGPTNQLTPIGARRRVGTDKDKGLYEGCEEEGRTRRRDKRNEARSSELLVIHFGAAYFSSI